MPNTITYIEVQTTVERPDDAQRIASILVENRLAACVQIEGPLTSTYRWQGAVTTAPEWRCTIKTRLVLFEKLEAALREIHPYALPEIVAFALPTGSKDYFNWIDDATKAI